jgi:hypothetical protein
MFVYHSGHLWIVRGFSTIEVYPIVQFDCPVEKSYFPLDRGTRRASHEGVLRHVFDISDWQYFLTLRPNCSFDLLLMIRYCGIGWRRNAACSTYTSKPKGVCLAFLQEICMSIARLEGKKKPVRVNVAKTTEVIDAIFKIRTSSSRYSQSLEVFDGFATDGQAGTVSR